MAPRAITRAGRKERRVLLLGMNPPDTTVRGAFDYARTANWLLTMVGWYEESPAVLVKNWDCDGFLVAPDKIPECPPGRAWHRYPVVAINETDRGYPRVVLDLQAAGVLAAEHFIERGFAHLAYCSMGSHWTLLEQQEGFRRAALAAGKTFHCLDWQQRPRRLGRWSWGNFRLWLADQLGGMPTPLALMVDSPWTGQEAVEACSQMGVLVPEQVAVITCYEEPAVCEGALVPLSSVDVDFRRAGYEGAALLDRLMNGEPAPKGPILVPPRGIVVRQSSDIIAIPHVEVAKAVRFIQTHYADPRVGVPQVVEATAMSKTGLKEAFRRHVGCPTGQYLHRTRMEHARRLLVDTAMTIAAVAAACGFSGPESLHDAVVRQTGQSPRAWRRKQQAAAGTD